TNLPVVREDAPDSVYKTSRAKFAAVVAEVAEKYEKGQPVLVGTTSIEKNEIVSKFLKKKKIPHQVLNAKNHEKEAQIIAQAGGKKIVTVATNMAGRGVDIVLGGARPKDRTKKAMAAWQKLHDEVVELGGLHVIGTERHESRRIDNQLRGRAGRQGDPGSSRFYVALNDEIMRLFGGEKIARLMSALKMPENQPIEHAMISKAIEQAQSKVESFHFDMRKRVVEYDDVMNRQREIVYTRRIKILKGEGGVKEKILERIKTEMENLVAMYAPEGIVVREAEKIVGGLCEILPLDIESQKRVKEAVEKASPQKATDLLVKAIEKAYEMREGQVGAQKMRGLEQALSLMTMDRLWIRHLEEMKSLREGIGLRGYAQQDPLVEYKKEAYIVFESLLTSIDTEIAKRIFRLRAEAVGSPVINFGAREGRDEVPGASQIGQSALSTPQSASTQPKPVISGKKMIGRNDPCWCDSGKKWKKCHYPELG
ncbi:SEC-C domain-containing protein, partial [Patescibacteria group bacterium]|nr:SEC-C domain-containing protein [Patescibacteria group bacterium]